jgi:hypothetical protein
MVNTADLEEMICPKCQRPFVAEPVEGAKGAKGAKGGQRAKGPKGTA